MFFFRLQDQLLNIEIIRNVFIAPFFFLIAYTYVYIVIKFTLHMNIQDVNIKPLASGISSISRSSLPRVLTGSPGGVAKRPTETIHCWQRHHNETRPVTMAMTMTTTTTLLRLPRHESAQSRSGDRRHTIIIFSFFEIEGSVGGSGGVRGQPKLCNFLF